jgi:phosphoesterase RecJ-like protein
MDPQSVAAIAEVLDRSDRVLVATHIQPDGDAISSLLAISFALEQLNISFDLVCDDKLPLRFNFLPNINLIRTRPPRDVNHDLLIALDAADEMRLGQAFAALDYPKPPILNIDHHVTNNNYGIINIVDSQASSTTEVLHQLFPLLGVDINTNIAQCLLTGLITDTLNFSTSSVSSTTPLITSGRFSKTL